MSFPVSRIAEPLTVKLIAPSRIASELLHAPSSAAALAEIADLTKSSVNFPVFGNAPYADLLRSLFAGGRACRFNRANKGAWYAALTTETCLREVIFHFNRELEKVNHYHTTTEYSELFASFSGNFIDLRYVNPAPNCLHPDPEIGYPAGALLAEEALIAGHNGVIYPSVRHPGGVCLAALQPYAVQSIIKGDTYRIEWTGTPEPRVERL